MESKNSVEQTIQTLKGDNEELMKENASLKKQISGFKTSNANYKKQIAHLKQLDKAVTHLKKAAEKADNNSLSPTFLIQAGQILESQDKKEEALKLYKQVKEKYFQSMQYQTIDEYIERASK
jgi:predicted negative regulator of RcsB-dependent stress response